LSEALHESQSDIELFKATFKTLKEHETEITLDDFQENTVASESSSEIIAEDAAHTRALYADSMRGYPAETKERLLAEFDSHMQDEKSRFTTLRHKGKIVGSLCFTETAPGQKYVSAVTLDPRFQKAFIGEAMIDEAFKQEAAQNILGAD
jgi:ribosomal protein S18 acetylase RimI-like enzyme